MGIHQPRFLYGPLLGFFLGLAFAKTSAKFYDFKPMTPWYITEQPPHYSDEEYLSQWHPLKNSYYTVTTSSPQTFDLPSAFSSVSDFGGEAAASNVNLRRRKPNDHKNTKRENTKHRRINSRPKRRRRTTTTTTEAYYYDDDYYSEEYDEDFSEEVRPIKRRRITTPSGTEDYQDYSVEVATKPKKRKKPTTVNSASIEDENTIEVTTIKLLAQRQETTTETTTEITTTNTTDITSTTTFAGYDGINLHDNITFTYGPPTSNNNGPIYANYGPPALSKDNYPPLWYTPFKSRNDIVKRVQDIVGEDDFLGLGDLQS